MSTRILPSEHQARTSAVVEAATSVFLRYGYARTTMAELAAASNLSRPTLYEIFPGKDELFAAVIQQMSHSTLERYRSTLPRLKTLGTKLHRFCGDWATHGLKLAERYPDAKDLFDFRFPAVRQMYEDFILFLVEVLSGSAYSGKLPVDRVVRNLVFSMRGLKDAARDLDQMQALIALQVDIFLATLDPAESG